MKLHIYLTYRYKTLFRFFSSVLVLIFCVAFTVSIWYCTRYFLPGLYCIMRFAVIWLTTWLSEFKRAAVTLLYSRQSQHELPNDYRIDYLKPTQNNSFQLLKYTNQKQKNEKRKGLAIFGREYCIQVKPLIHEICN